MQTLQRIRNAVRIGAAALAFATGATTGHARQSPPPSYGHDFVTVGAPGNRAALESERYYGSAVTGFPNLGAVNYSYRISRTETTVRQWFDFVQVFWPFADKLGISRLDQAFTGGITASNLTPGTQPGWYYLPEYEQIAIETSFRFAARYVNWRHHGSPTTNLTLATFDEGAYDAAALTRQPGARFWIPSLDEWTKAVYYDPNRYGPGQEGYWLHSGMSMTPLVGGPPGTPGAQTSGGGWYQGGVPPPPVGSYPQTVSPWGLLDTSGGKAELTDTLNWFNVPNQRVVRGQGLEFTPSFDRNDYIFLMYPPDGGTAGLRIASLVPCAGTFSAMALALVYTGGRRRRAM